MIAKPFEPTDEQLRVIEHAGSAFIAACPGAGKTRVMVERARKLLGGRPTGRGISFLSLWQESSSRARLHQSRDLALKRLGWAGAPARCHGLRR